MADLVRTHLRDQPPVPHDADARAGFLGAKQVVRRHEHRDAPIAQPSEQLRELVRGLRVEAGRRLVEQQRVGLLGDGDGDADLLAHALGVLGHPALHRVARQARADQDVGEPLGSQRSPPAQRGEVLQVLQAAEVAVQHHLLGDVGQAPLGLQGLGGDIEAGHVHAAGRRLEEPQKQVDGGRLAGAVRAQQTVDLGWSDAEVEARDGLHVAIALGQRPRLENGGRRDRRGRGPGIDRFDFAHCLDRGPLDHQGLPPPTEKERPARRLRVDATTEPGSQECERGVRRAAPGSRAPRPPRGGHAPAHPPGSCRRRTDRGSRGHRTRQAANLARGTARTCRPAPRPHRGNEASSREPATQARQPRPTATASTGLAAWCLVARFARIRQGAARRRVHDIIVR